MEAESSMLKVGDRIRREVLGDEHVDRASFNATTFSRPVQEFVTEHCWGDIWSREGLARRDRSLVNLGMLVALAKPGELRNHVRGALRNGLTVDEIREVILQTAIYCGVPAALEASRAAEAELKELGVLPPGPE
jgi:4-carboxymuconolactone decarboxylase